MPTIPQFWLYRSIAYMQHGGHRAYWSTTWLSTDPEVGNDIPAGIFADFMSFDLIFPFGLASPWNYSGAGNVVQRLHPTLGLSRSFTFPTTTLSPLLNVNAPEAALRLQRVGADGGSSGLGRICYPILHDSWFTDLPHRRHVDVATFQPLINANMGFGPFTGTYHGRTLHHVIFHRRTFTWTPVTHYVLKPNPVRIWERSRPYPGTHNPASDAVFKPDELEWR